MARAGLTPERLIDAAAKLADEAGFEAVTPSALARLFDVRVASLYSHVASANDVKVRLALHALDKLADRIAEAVAGRSGRDALVALADAYRDFAQAHPGLFVAARHPLDADAAAGSGGVRIAQATRAVLRAYGLDEPAQTHAVRLLGSVVLGFLTLEQAGGFSHSQPSSQASWRAALDALHVMLCSLADEGGRDD
jgi:AcrR family transcriptional regulator